MESESKRTNAPIVAGKAELFKHHLIAMRLQRGEAVWLLGEDQPRLGRVTSLGRLVVKELAIPDLLLRIPAHDEPLLNGASKSQFAKIPAFLQFGADIRLSMAVAGEVVGDDPGTVGRVT